jgi:predicted CoA-binding protein
MNIAKFLSAKAFAVAGASSNRNKFGNKVLRCYIQNNKTVYPVNLHESTIEGLICVDKIEKLPSNVKSLSIVTPPAITEQLVEQAIQKGIKNIWIQPGAESEVAILNCKRHKINYIAHGPCILVELKFQEE